MTVYYVRTNGDDSTGNGSTETPWLTIKKAIATVTSGDTILVGDGVYAENDGGSLVLKRAFLSYVTVVPENGASGNVTITTTSGTLGTIANTSAAAYYKFQYITFTTLAGAGHVLRFNIGSDHIDFEDCIFNPVQDAAQTIFISNSSTWNVSNITFTRCTLNKPVSSVNHVALLFNFTSTGASSNINFIDCTIRGIKYGYTPTGADGVNFTNCTISSDTNSCITHAGAPENNSYINCNITGYTGGLIANGAVGLIVSNTTVTTLSDGVTIQFGADSTTGAATSVTMTNVIANHPRDKTGHAVLYGAGVITSICNGLTVPCCYDYALCIKENTGTEVKNCNLHAGTGTTFGAALYFKAAVSPNAHNNRLFASGTGTYCFQLAKGDTGTKCSDWLFDHNILCATGLAKTLNIGTDTDDAGGGVCNYNKIRHSTGAIGLVRADTDVKNLVELRAAWAAYGDGSNDNRSSMLKNSGNSLLIMQRI